MERAHEKGQPKRNCRHAEFPSRRATVASILDHKRLSPRAFHHPAPQPRTCNARNVSPISTVMHWNSAANSF